MTNGSNKLNAKSFKMAMFGDAFSAKVATAEMLEIILILA